MTNKYLKITTLIFFVLIVILLFALSFTLGFYSQDSTKENHLLKTILMADIDLSEISIDNQMASQYYDEAVFAYEKGNFQSVESNCRLARRYYLKTSQGYKEIKAELKNSGIEDNLIDIYVDMLESRIKMANNLFESCEHLESAVRYYDIYYNTNVPYDDMSYEMGIGEIDKMNEKIKAHDEAVEIYNNKLAEFGVELEKRM